jgi:hypothetical protein
MSNETGLSASIYTNRQYATCSNRGISSRFAEVVVVAVVAFNDQGQPHVVDVVGPSRVAADRPAVALVKRNHFGRGVTVSAQPYGQGLALTGWMAGGAFIASSDQRFGEASGFYGAVCLHDRREDGPSSAGDQPRPAEAVAPQPELQLACPVCGGGVDVYGQGDYPPDFQCDTCHLAWDDCGKPQRWDDRRRALGL